MVITYAGGECFKITQGDLTIALNPPVRDSDIKVSRFGSDVVLISSQHPDFSGIETASFGDREPFVISGPGEYEIRGIVVYGFPSDSEYGGMKSINTLYSLSLEGISLCFLGALGSTQLPSTAKQELDDVDILFLPIGGDGVLDYMESYKLAVQLEPKVIVPMHYGAIGQKEALRLFLKEAGVDKGQPIEKLTVRKKDLEGKEGEVVLLSA